MENWEPEGAAGSSAGLTWSGRQGLPWLFLLFSLLIFRLLCACRYVQGTFPEIQPGLHSTPTVSVITYVLKVPYFPPEHHVIHAVVKYIYLDIPQVPQLGRG